jgi:hypothetical protein
MTPLALAVGLAAAGCSDLLNEEPQGATTMDAFFKTGADLNTATIAIYNALRGLQGQSQWTTLELASDQTRSDNREPNAGTYGPDRLDWDASTGRTDQYWPTGYSMITRANLVLARGPGIEVPAPLAPMKAYNLAEAKFFRGYAYFMLSRAYDGVPLLLTPEEQENLRPTRTPYEQVHQAAIADLTDAQAALPADWGATDSYGTPTQGRITKAAAQMALADLYLWRSSFLGRNEWQQASDWADSVIASGRWRLNDDYFSTFLPRNKFGNREMIFTINNSGLNGRTSSIFQLFYYPRDWGLDLGQGGGWGLIHPTDWFLGSYNPGDYRKDAGYINSGCSFDGKHCFTPPDTFADGRMPWKYVKSDGGANWGLNDVDVPLYRYAEALLIYAEAQNELGNTGQAVTYLNLIRARARKGTGSESRTEPHDYGAAGEPMDKVSVREAIFMERAWEFAFEAKRWFDLVRRDSEEPGYWQSSLLAHDNPNNKLVAKLVADRKRFPIPQSQINANPALCQNPGYGGTPCPPGVSTP